MVRKNPSLQPNRKIRAGDYLSSLTLADAIRAIYPDCNNFTYPNGEAGRMFSDGSFVSFNGRIGKITHAHCDFKDKKKVPLSATNKSDLLKLRLIQPK